MQDFPHQAPLQIAAVHRHAGCNPFPGMPEKEVASFLAVINKTALVKRLNEFPSRDRRQTSHRATEAVNGNSKPTCFFTERPSGIGWPCSWSASRYPASASFAMAMT